MCEFHPEEQSDEGSQDEILRFAQNDVIGGAPPDGVETRDLRLRFFPLASLMVRMTVWL